MPYIRPVLATSGPGPSPVLVESTKKALFARRTYMKERPACAVALAPLDETLLDVFERNEAVLVEAFVAPAGCSEVAIVQSN